MGDAIKYVLVPFIRSYSWKWCPGPVIPATWKSEPIGSPQEFDSRLGNKAKLRLELGEEKIRKESEERKDEVVPELRK